MPSRATPAPRRQSHQQRRQPQRVDPARCALRPQRKQVERAPANGEHAALGEHAARCRVEFEAADVGAPGPALRRDGVRSCWHQPQNEPLPRPSLTSQAVHVDATRPSPAR